MKTPIYMDHHSTTPMDPCVLEAMHPFLTNKFGNAASQAHVFGRQASEAVEEARGKIAAVIGARPEEIAFTSGATESDNTTLLGLSGEDGDHVITSPTEHRAVLDPAKQLERRGFKVTYLPVDRYGFVDPADVERAITRRTVLVSLMAANNEVGLLHPLEEIGEITRRKGVLFHSDAAQALGKVPLHVTRMNLDLVSFSAHKIYGPKGVGALYIRLQSGARLTPLIHGGGQERGLRSGTLNVPGIVGFGKAVELACGQREAEARKLAGMRDRLHEILRSELEGVELNGHPRNRLPNNLNVSFMGVDGEALILSLEDVALSTGSACMSLSAEPSHVLEAMGLGNDRIRSSVRFGLGRFNTDEEIEYVGGRVVEVVKRLRRLAPLNASG